jgi:hypothetical protein
VISHITLRLLYPYGKNFWCPPKKRLNGPQRQRHFGKQTHFLSLTRTDHDSPLSKVHSRSRQSGSPFHGTYDALRVRTLARVGIYLYIVAIVLDRKTTLLRTQSDRLWIPKCLRCYGP